MKKIRVVCLSLVMLLVASVSFAGGFFFTCDVGGAKLEVFEHDGSRKEVGRLVRKARREKIRMDKKEAKAEKRRIRILEGLNKRNEKRIANGKDPLPIPSELATSSVQVPEPDEDGFVDVGGFPRLLDRPRYSFVTIRVSAVGYETFEADFENNKLGLNHFNIALVPEDDYPESLSLFGLGGRLIPKSASFVRSRYLVVIRNLTLWKQVPIEDKPYVGKDIEVKTVNVDGGWFSSAYENKETNITVRVGDQIAFIARDIVNEKKIYGSRAVVVTEEDMENGQLVVEVLTR